jgi:hypothetical protein
MGKTFGDYIMLRHCASLEKRGSLAKWGILWGEMVQGVLEEGLWDNGTIIRAIVAILREVQRRAAGVDRGGAVKNAVEPPGRTREPATARRNRVHSRQWWCFSRLLKNSRFFKTALRRWRMRENRRSKMPAIAFFCGGRRQMVPAEIVKIIFQQPVRACSHCLK